MSANERPVGFNPIATVTLTVTDSAGQSGSDTMTLAGIDVTPD